MSLEGARPDEPSLVPHLFVRDVDRAISFYQAGFAANVLYRGELPQGRGVHAQLRVGNSILMLTTEMKDDGAPTGAPETLGAVSAIVEIYVEDVDAVVERAVEAGAGVLLAPRDWFFGDRYAQLRDPAGHVWGIATVREVVPPDEAERRAR